ncbi:MAG: Flp pilus assembly protein CpaB [Pseudobacteriovorax sp.]|nr:Flp pilus assembly protein CpaB [Pseudobacteriovorax sp.]
MKQSIQNFLSLFKTETIIVVLAVLLGGVGALIEHSNQEAFRDKLFSDYQLTSILVTSDRIISGSVLKKSDLKTKKVLTSSLTGNMVRPKEINTILGKSVKISLGKGDPVLLSMIGGTFHEDSIANKIPEGKRLFMMTVKDSVAKNGFIRPGDYVDILTIMELPRKGLTSFTLLPKIQLVAVGKSLDPSTGIESSEMSFFVTPKEMEVLKFAEGKGEFSLALRNPNDAKQLARSKGVDMQKFLESDMLYEPADLPVEVINGPKKKKKKR